MGQDPLWQQAPADHSAVFRPLDLEIRVRATDRRLIDLAARVLEPDSGMRSSEHTYGVRTIEAGQRPSMSMLLVAGGEQLGAEPGRTVHRERDGMYAASVDGVGLATAHLASGTAAAFIELAHLGQMTEGALPIQPAEVLIGSPVWRFAAYQGLVALHAGAVAGPLGTLVIRGPAGSGKSTTVVSAGRAGWTVLADEVVWFDPLVEPPLLRGTGAHVQLEVGNGAKAPLPGWDAQSIEFSRQAPLGCVVCLVGRDAAGSGSWHPLEGEEAVKAFGLGAHPGEGTQVGALLARARNRLLSLGCYALVAGAPPSLPEQLAGIAAHARGRAASTEERPLSRRRRP